MLEALNKNESFTYNKLSPAEMEARGILGRLVGPCAEFTIPTRNGRKYNEQLWENVFADEIVNEKIANKCLFGELGHPLDREEVDPEKIAIALNEVPKKNKDGQLIACFDILNTPSGKILKTLCDYGTTIGISSRGSGDIITNNLGEEIVDPNTYYFECFDAVLLPAVKSARVAYMHEGLDTKKVAMKKALREAIDTASVEDKKIMNETLAELNIDINENEDKKLKVIETNEVPLIEETDEEVAAEEEAAVEGEIPAAELDIAPIEEPQDEEQPQEEAEGEEKPVEPEEALDSAPVETTVGEIKEIAQEVAEEAAEEAVALETDAAKEDVELDGETKDRVADIADEVVEDKLNDNKEEEIPSDDTENADEATELTDEAPVEEPTEEETAIDDGEEADEPEKLLDSLKEAFRQKSSLEAEVKSLKEEKTVSDAKVNTLQEEVNKYKAAFYRISEVAGKAQKVENETKQLKEELMKRDSEIAELQKQAKSSKAMTESLTAENATKIKNLSENLEKAQAELAEVKENLSTRVNSYKSKFEESIKVAKAYKEALTKTLDRYIESKASMLGVRVADIKGKLSEKYTINEIDAVCDKLLNESVNYTRLPLGINGKSSIKINESKQRVSTAPEYGYEIDDQLLELAGLKK